jgi:hypothetical protein
MCMNMYAYIFQCYILIDSYVTFDSQSVNMSWCRAHSGLVTRHYFLSEGFCQKIAFLSLLHILMKHTIQNFY